MLWDVQDANGIQVAQTRDKTTAMDWFDKGYNLKVIQ